MLPHIERNIIELAAPFASTLPQLKCSSRDVLSAGVQMAPQLNLQVTEVVQVEPDVLVPVGNVSIVRAKYSAVSQQPIGLSFWRNRFNETKICPLPSEKEETIRYNGTAVPLQYRIYDDGTSCTRQFIEGGSSFKNATQFQLNKLKYYGADSAILLLEKGKKFISRWHDYLFSDFYDPYVNVTQAIPTFFLYEHVFQNDILGLIHGSDISRLQLKFHRPLPYPIDFSMIIMWLLAVGCVAGGGVWAFFRH
ncbi:unnamed protein product, partial [Strongylus vulgaris]